MLSFPNRCQHIKVGTQCGCPALRRNKLCYFHKRHHDERIQLNLDRVKDDRARLRPATLELPVLEDANSIQVSLMQIMRLVAAGRIELKAAGLLLYALQTASANLSRTSFEPHTHNVVLDPRAVDQTPLGAYIWEDPISALPAMTKTMKQSAQRLSKKPSAKPGRKRNCTAGPRLKPIASSQKALANAKPPARLKPQPAPAKLNARQKKNAHSPPLKMRAPHPPSRPPDTPSSRPRKPRHCLPNVPPPTSTWTKSENKLRDQIRKEIPAIVAAQPDRKPGRRAGWPPPSPDFGADGDGTPVT